MLDFAFLDILSGDKRGLLSRKFFLDTVAPVFFRPRARKTIQLGSLGLKGCQVLVPLGQGNWAALKSENQARLWQESGQVAREFGLPALAVNRVLRHHCPAAAPVELVWGDCFILALALVLAEQVVSHYGADKLFLVGDFPGLPGLVTLLGGVGIPVIAQTFHPGQYEHLAHHMLYDQGVALSVTYFNPRNWGPGDVVLVFDPTYNRFILGKKGSLLISLTDDSHYHAPELEQSLQHQGVDASLKNLAPILEAYLLSNSASSPPVGPPVSGSDAKPDKVAQRPEQAAPASDLSTPSAVPSREKEARLSRRRVSYRQDANKIMSVKRKGEYLNLWSFFLDKDFRALYNTIQGIRA